MLHVFLLFCLCWWRLIGAFDELISVMEGDSVTFSHTDLTEIQNGLHLVWEFGAEKCKIRGNKIKNDQCDERFRNRLKVDHQTGSLTFTNITTDDAGDYRLEILGRKTSSKNITVSVYARLPIPIIRNSSQCSSSDQNCSLLCSVVNVSHVTLSWYKGNSLLSSISVSDLSISLSLPLEVEYQDTNTYRCVVSNPISNQTQHLNISQLCHTCEDQGLHLFYKVLISVSGSLLIVAAVGIFCICRKYRKSDKEVVTGDEDIMYAEPTFLKQKAQSSVEAEDSVEYAPIILRR